MALNKRSQLITQGVARSPNRAMLRAVGFGDGDFEKPIIGVANGHSTMNPCNAGIQPLVDRAIAALRNAGAMPQVFGVPTVTDGIGMGTEAMKYSLVSREVIADAIETAVNGQSMDGVLVCGGCDKNMPGGMIAMVRMNVPGIYVYAGTIKPGRWKGQDLTIVSAFEAVGAYAAGKMSDEDFIGIEKERMPERRRLRRHVHREYDVVLVRSARHEPARLVAARFARFRESRFCGEIRRNTGARGERSDQAARHRDAQVDRERGCAHHGDRRLDQRGAALPGDCARRRGQMDDRRFRAHSKESARAVRPQAFGPLCRSGFQRRGRCAAGAQDVARARSSPRRLHDDHRAHDRRRAQEGARRAARGPGRDPALGKSDVHAGPPRDPQRQSRAGRLRGQDHRA